MAVAEPNGLEVRPRRWLPVEPPLELAEATGVVASSHGRPAVHLPAPHDGERYALHLVPAQLARDPLTLVCRTGALLTGLGHLAALGLGKRRQALCCE